MPATHDRIDREITLRAPQDRVWRAVSDAAEFGAWFGISIDGAFEPGTTLHGTVTSKSSECDATRFAMYVESVEPQHLISWRWHAHAWEADRDYSGEPTTLVEFRLTPVDGGTHLTICESGFEAVPEDCRVKAFERNSGGWTHQIAAIARYVDGP